MKIINMFVDVPHPFPSLLLAIHAHISCLLVFFYGLPVFPLTITSFLLCPCSMLCPDQIPLEFCHSVQSIICTNHA